MADLATHPGLAANPGLAAYLSRGITRVDGWFTPLDAQMVAALALGQIASGVTGAVGEIGVHHGRMFLLMALTLAPGERAFAIDLFADQDNNIDRSGHGDEAIFRANLARHAIAPDRVAIFARSSLEITWPEVAAVVGPRTRLFSVDGGHTAEIVANDMAIAANSLAEGGIIVADDYFNRDFPGVSEGISRFLIAHRGEIVPFALGDGRLFLCHPDWAARYRDILAQSPAARLFHRVAAMFGGEVAIHGTPRSLFEHVRRLKWVQAMRDHPTAIRLKPLVRRILTRGGRSLG